MLGRHLDERRSDLKAKRSSESLPSRMPTMSRLEQGVKK